MKKFLVLCMLGLLVVASCNNNKQTSSNGEKLDTVWNEKVQDTFYGLRLGDSLDVNTIVATLEAMVFGLMKNIAQKIICILEVEKASTSLLEDLDLKC